MELDWQRLEEVVTRAVLRARSEEMKEVADAVKLLASYVREGFEGTFKALGRREAAGQLRGGGRGPQGAL